MGLYAAMQPIFSEPVFSRKALVRLKLVSIVRYARYADYA
jgi:hypothetical protein